MLQSRRLRVFLPVLWFAFGYFTHVIFNTDIPVKKSTSIRQGNHQFLVILVLSSLGNQERRQAIRETWAANVNSDVKLYFVISSAGIPQDQLNGLQEESDKLNDLLLLNGVEDSFHTLTLKILLAFSWLTDDNKRLGPLGNSTTQRPFDSFSYVLKCDDDSYVRINEIVDDLKSTNSHEMLYWGFFDGRAKVKKAGKYKELAWNICDTYLPYALGGGYIIASLPIKFITKNVEHWKKYQSEDTSVGAWLANLEGVHRVHDPRFDTEYLSRGCHQSYLVTHKHAAATMRKIHEHLSNTGKLCPKEYRTRLSYRYDWNVTPSKCCLRNNPNIP